jgi:O-antigen biosynthesis protein
VSDRRAKVVDAAWLSRSVLLVVGGSEVDPGDARATLVAGDESVEVDVQTVTLTGSNGSRDEEVLLTAGLRDDSGARTASKLALRAGKDGQAVELKLTHLGNLFDERLDDLEKDVAKRVLETILSAHAGHAHADRRNLSLSNTLHNIRNTLRPRLQAVKIERDTPLCGNVDVLVPVDESTFFISGWLRDGEARIERFTAVTAEGERIELLDRIHRLELGEFEEFHGGPYAETADAAMFICLFETKSPSHLRKSWVFEVQNETGRAVEMYQLPDVPTDVRAARAHILRSVPESALPNNALMTQHVYPAIERLQQRARDAIEVESLANYGDLPDAPEASIVVPLYKRIDLVEHQLVQFASDPELKEHELIYVLDSPELQNELADRARQYAKLYGVPFRVLTMKDNVGFGAAVHTGVGIARGRVLLLLNSDVLPVEPGWLGKLIAFHDATPDIGALGPKLLYEDDSLQHAGLFFDRIQEGPTAGSWANMHYFKGLHRDLPAANVARPVPAVTAACLMIQRDLYYKAGGMPDVYVQGDYEDSELCLRLLEEGRENWYLPAVELYHLEGTSYSEEERGITAAYNRWLQTRRMGQQIEDAMGRYSRI